MHNAIDFLDRVGDARRGAAANGLADEVETRVHRGEISPVLASQRLDAAEFAEIAGDDNQSAAARVVGDQQITGANDLALTLEAGADVGGLRRGVDVVGQDFQPRPEALDFLLVSRRIRKIREFRQSELQIA